MKTKRSFPIVTVTPKAETAIKKGHPWVYDAEITDSFGDTANGCLVDVLSRKGSYLGTGLLSLESKIRVRILSSNANESFTPAFWERRLRYAIDYRRTVMGGDFSCCRLVFGEADGLPGLTVDRFSDLLSVQIASYGMDKLKDTLYPLLIKILAEGGDTINGIYERNGLDGRMDFLAADVFDLLPELEKNGKKPYDLIILDPPAFTKSRRTVGSAERGYKEINYRAMKLLPRGGYLATCSCSHFMPSELFTKMLLSAAADAGVQLKQIEARQQCRDHPVLLSVPETDYLKFYIFQVV